MFSISWADTQRLHTLVGDANAVMAVYAFLDYAKKVNRRTDICSIHIYSVSTGLEFNPETGLQVVIPSKG